MKSYALLSCMASMAVAQMTHTVMVGGSTPAATGKPTPILGYQPESVKAKAGDVIEFHFMQINHTVTQSTFANPCVKMDGGVDSGFMPNPDGKAGVTYQVPVKDEKPLWMYCKQKKGTHCGKGMVFAVNAAESGDKTFAAYKQLAIAQNGTDLQDAGIVNPGSPAAPPAAVSADAGAPGAAPTGAAGAAPSVVPGQGQAADGSTCQCSCLCGAGSFPAGAGAQSFGGFGGMLPPA